MRIYMKNKSFIPEKFYNSRVLYSNRKENKLLIIFVILNLILFTQSIKYLSREKEAPIVNITYNENKIKNLDNINIWINAIVKSDIKEANIVNDKGEILVEDLNNINEKISDNILKINSVNLNNDSKYKIGVSLND